MFLTPSPTGNQGVFHSPSNSLLADVRDPQDAAAPHRQAFVPTWEPDGFPEAYRTLNTRYKAEWGAFFEREGWSPTRVDATRLGHAYGLFRCLTSPISPLGSGGWMTIHL